MYTARFHVLACVLALHVALRLFTLDRHYRLYRYERSSSSLLVHVVLQLKLNRASIIAVAGCKSCRASKSNLILKDFFVWAGQNICLSTHMIINIPSSG